MTDNRWSSRGLYETYLEDRPEIDRFVERITDGEFTDRLIRRHRKDTEAFVSRMFRLAGGREYLVSLAYSAKGTGKSKQWFLATSQFRLVKRSQGLCAVSFFDDSRQALLFTPHFFFRYRERFGQKADWKTRNRLAAAKELTAIMSVYFGRNKSITWIETEAAFRDAVHIFAPVTDGVALLQWSRNKRLLQANTFLTHDMLSKRQKEMVGWAETYIAMTDEERAAYDVPDFASDNPEQGDGFPE